MPVPKTRQTRRRASRSWRPAPMIDCGRYRRQAHRRRRRARSAPTSSATATTSLRAVVRSCAPGAQALAREPDAAHRRAHRRRPLGGRVRRSPARTLHVDDRGLDRRVRGLARGAAAQDRRRPGATSPASCPRASCCSSAAAARAKGADRERIERALERCATARRRRRAHRGRARRPSCSRPSSATPTAAARRRWTQRLHVDVDRVRARFGAWYELFPRSWGGLQGVAEAVPELAELGFDVLYLPPVHPIGLTNRKGANNALTRGARRPRLAVGDRRRDRRAHGAAPRPRHDRGLRRARRRRPTSTASTSRWTSRSSARPTTRG